MQTRIGLWQSELIEWTLKLVIIQVKMWVQLFCVLNTGDSDYERLQTFQ